MDLTVHTRNLRRQYSKTSRNVKPGTLVIIPVEGDEHGPPSFEVAKVLNVKGKIKDSGHHELLVQYYGNNSGKVLGAYRPGWIFNDRRSKSTKHYFQKTPSRKTHEPYTNDISGQRITTSMVHISGFQLTTQDSLPAVIRDMINDSDSFEWKKPVPLQDEHDLIDMATFISAEVKHESNPDQKGHYTWK